MKTYDRADYAELCHDPHGPAQPGSGIERSCQYDEIGRRCFSCNVRSMRIQPDAMPSRRNNLPPTVSENANAIERGILRDERGVPYRDAGKVIGLKQYRDNRRHYDSRINEARTPKGSASPADQAAKAVTVVSKRSTQANSATTATPADSD